MKNIIFYSCIVMLMLTGCRKNVEINEIEENPHIPILLEGYEPSVENINSSVYGTLSD